jgi:hypothetical protein
MLASPSANSSLLKRIYGSKVSELTYKRDKLLEAAKKDTNFRGVGREVTIAIAGTAGGSADFAAALAAQQATVERTFLVTHKKEYQLYSIANDAIERSKGNQAALVEILKRQVMGAKRKFDESIAKRTHGVGPIGRIQASSSTSTTTLTLRDRTDIVGVWELNALIDFAPNDGTSTVTSVRAGGPLKVTALNRDAGTVTLNAIVNTVTTNTDDFIHRYGDYSNAMTGLQAWEPTSAPGATAFYGVDRTEDLLKESGVRVFGGGKLKEETLQDAGAECQINGISPSTCLVNPLDFKDIGKELGGAKVQEGGKGVTGFSSIVVHIATGEVTVMSSPYVKKGYFWMGNPGENFTLGTAGECPMDLTSGGPLLLPTADAKQGRLGCYGNFWVDNPGEWLIGAWNASS